MITLTLLQGVVNTFVLFFSRVIGFLVDRVVLRNERGLGIGYFVSSIVAQIVLGILASTIVMFASTIVMWFSRRREFRADESGAELSSNTNMINALKRLKRSQEMPDTMPDTLTAFGISSGSRSGIKALFASHPPLDDRIAALERANRRRPLQRTLGAGPGRVAGCRKCSGPSGRTVVRGELEPD